MATEQNEGTMTAPTDEQVMEVLNGNGDNPVEQAEPAATTKTEAPAPAGSTDIAALLEEKLKQALGPIQSEIGQFRKVRSEFDKFRTAQKQTPNQPPKAWSDLTPEQQEALNQLNEHWFTSSQQGQRLMKVAEMFEAREQEMAQAKMLQSAEGYAKEYAGEQYKDLDPIAGRIVNEMMQKAEAGDEGASELLDGLAQGRRYAVEAVINRARQEYAASAKAKEAEAKAKTQATAKRVSATVTSANQQTAETGDEAFLANLPSDPGKAAAILKEELRKRGML